MRINGVIPQLRTTDLAGSIEFYVTRLGATLEFRYEDFYAGVRLGDHVVHLKHVDEPDPGISYVREAGHLDLYIEVDDVEGVARMLRGNGLHIACDVHDTDWNTRELVIEDDQGHTLYFGQPLERNRA